MIAHPVAVYLGGISYGLYVWHGLLPALVRSVEERTGRSLHLTYRPGWSRFLYVLPLTVIIATVSWYVLERPFNDLKVWFPFRRQTARGVTEQQSRAANSK